MSEASCLQLDSSSANDNQNQNSYVARSSQSDRPDNGEISAVSSLSPPMTKSEKPTENFCDEVSSYSIRMDQPLIMTQEVHYLDILTYVINALNLLSSSSLMRINDDVIQGTGPAGAIECMLSEASYGVGSFSLTDPDYNTVQENYMLLNALFLKRGDQTRFFAKDWGLMKPYGYNKLLADLLKNDTGLPINLEFIKTLKDGVSFVWINENGLTTEMPDTFQCMGRFTNLELETERIFSNLAQFISILTNFDKTLHTESLNFINNHLSKCSINLHEIIAEKSPPSYKSMQKCLLTDAEIKEHLREKRDVETSRTRFKRSDNEYGLNNKLLQFQLESFGADQLSKVNENFRKLFSGQDTILTDLARLTVTLEALHSKEKTDEDNLTKLRNSLLYTNSETRVLTIFNQYKLINQDLIKMTHKQHDTLTDRINEIIGHAVQGLTSPNSLDCDNKGCSSRQNIFFVTSPKTAKKYAFGKSLTSRQMKSLSCFASQNKFQLIANFEKIASSNITHIKTTNNNVISAACLKDERHCDISHMIPIKSNSLVKGNIFITLRDSSMFFQCVHRNWVLTTADNTKLQCSLRPVKVKLPISLLDGSRIGSIDYAEFNVINRDPSAISDDLLKHHNSLVRVKQKWNNKDINSMIHHSLGELADFEEIKPSHVLAAVIVLTMALLCSPCLIMAIMTMLKCLPSCLKKWSPSCDCKFSWCKVFISLCDKSRKNDSGFHETFDENLPQTPEQIRSSPKTPSAPKQMFKREKTRESRLRKKSLQSGFNYWDTSIQNDESKNLETTEAQAPPIAVSPVTNYSSVYPHFATPSLVQPQLHYNPNIATVAYTPAKQ